jgi:hypothetical protein
MTAPTKKSKKSPAKKYKPPSAFDLFTPSVNLIRNNLEGFAVLVGLPAALSLLGRGSGLFSNVGTTLNFSQQAQQADIGPLGLIALVIGVMAAPGVIVMQLAGVHNKPIEYGEAFRTGLRFFWRFIGMWVLVILMLVVALLLLVVPFFILLPRVVLASYYLIDLNLGPVQAIKASMADYKKYKGTWGVIGVEVLISFAGIIPFVGWLVTAVGNFLYGPALAIRYEQIGAIANGKKPVTPIESSSAR